ncbi:Transcriptional regulator containing an AAA-type ATPase domain and a DNA-binding domain [Propionispira arboris]|uniref:Transcriptional regulator containing an AAA-type ATPase domain and a DNA-binding domain n=1 Tax=Propionispira arboris TaxID=84035 RepID=A0A1H7C6P6_9FIRM|nr:sigma 54-interacting transcriptional regulator [Propionispira arboris]SEJ84954.1 Transcriptional regulator containing an AAA-type ATPase domain and a DNA-binding domain [Propionispira arboris]
MEELIKIIANEDKKNPFTDEALANILHVTRIDVIKIRNSLGIENSRKRMRDELFMTIEKILQETPELSERALTKKINDEGYNISRHAVGEIFKQFKNQIIKKHGKEPVVLESEVIPKQNAFEAIIGSDGSLRSQVELAKASILYPPKGLHTLIVGATGVGKSELAHCMYKFALESGHDERIFPFVVFNCADYAETPQLLMSQLFGYVKGAFTGADTDRAGLVEKANNGILFLDEIHRLSPEGQEMLYYLIDKGKFRRLGENDNFRNISLMLIAATTENVESFLLLQFRRRIPMLIELPSLEQRPMEERLQIIGAFMREEANRLHLKVQVSYNVVVALLIYTCPGNIGQLYSDIQVACARSFLRHMTKKEPALKIEISDLRQQVVRGLLSLGEKRTSIEKILMLQGDLEFAPNDQSKLDLIQTTYLYPTDIYQEIENSYINMENQGIENAVINRIISEELEVKMRQFIKQTQQRKNNLARQDLEKIVSVEIICVVEKMINFAKRKMPDIDDSLLYCLATHLGTLFERQRMPASNIVNYQLTTLCDENPMEYALAQEMVKIANYNLKISLPEDETIFIAMYLKAYSKKDSLEEAHVGVLVLSHGHVAEGMVQVANRLLNVEYARAMEMPLEESCEMALQRTIDIVKQIDRGKGVLLLADMGSLVGFGKLITDQTGILVRTVIKVHTPMVMEAIRKALLPNMDIDEIVNSLKYDFSKVDEEICGTDRKIDAPSAIVTMCLTGIGTAKWIEDNIRKAIPEKLDGIDIIALGVLVEEDIQVRLRKLQEIYRIIAIVGTMGPVISGIPFISSTEMIRHDGIEKLKKLIDFSLVYNKQNKIQQMTLVRLFSSDLIFLQQKFNNKKDVLNFLGQALAAKGYIREQYILSIYEREKLAQSVFQNVGIPHGNPEFIIKPVIAVMTLKDSIEWNPGYKIDSVFMLALNQYQKEEFKTLYFLLNNVNVLNDINSARTVEEFMASIKNNLI